MEEREFEFEIRLLNRVKPQGMDDYKKSQKFAKHERTCDDDHLNRWLKKITVPPYSDIHREWSKEVSRLQESMKPWRVLNGETYGDMLIGFMGVRDQGEFYAPIYMTVRKLEYDIY